AVLLGAVGIPEVPPGVMERGLLLALRFDLDLYVNVRPFVAPPSSRNSGVDLVVVRENTRARTPARAATSAREPPTRSPPKVRSTPASAWNAACASPSSWPALASVATSRWSTTRTR